MPRKKSHVNNQIEMNVKLSNKKIQIKPKPKQKESLNEIVNKIY